MRIAPNQSAAVAFLVKGDDGALVDADATPTAVVLSNGFDTGITVFVESVATAGHYRATWTDNGASFAGSNIQLEVTATVGGKSYSAIVWQATMDYAAAQVSDVTSARDNITTAIANSHTAIITHGDGSWATPDLPENFAALAINSSGHIERVVLVDTTTTNADMRGTDGAVLEGSEMTLTAGERTAIAIAVEAALLNDGDGQALVDAIITRIENDLDASDVTVQAIGVAVRDAILDRVLALNHDTAGTVGRILQDTYAAASDLDNRATEARLAKLDRNLAAVSDVSDAASTVIAYGDSAWITASGFSTHDPVDVAAAILSNPANKLATDASGFVTLAQAFPANFAALGISAAGHVSRVTLVDATTSNSDMRGTDGANTLAPPTADEVRDAILDRALAGNHEVPGSLGAAVPELTTGLAGVIKSGEERTLTRTGKDPVTFTETRTV